MTQYGEWHDEIEVLNSSELRGVSSTSLTPSRRAAWACDPNFLTCHAGHLLRYRKTGFETDLRRLSGHAFFACHQCEPASHFFALFVTQPTPAVLCYALSRGSYDEWSRSPEGDTPETQQLLYLLRGPDGESLNANWRAPR